MELSKEQVEKIVTRSGVKLGEAADLLSDKECLTPEVANKLTEAHVDLNSLALCCVYYIDKGANYTATIKTLAAEITNQQITNATLVAEFAGLMKTYESDQEHIEYLSHRLLEAETSQPQ